MEAVLTGPMGRTLLGSSEVTIGCDADNAVIITDRRTSAHHAVVRPDGMGYAIIDLGSEYGTIVNGRWLEPNKVQPLLPGDTIQIGNTTLTFEVFQSPAAIPSGLLGVGVGSPARADGEPPPLPAPSRRPDIADQETTWINKPLDPAKPAAARALSKIDVSSLLSRLQPAQAPYTSQPWVSDGATTYPPQQHLWQQDRRRLSLALGIMLAILLIISLISLIATRSTPDKTLDAFCNGLLTGNRQQVFDQLSIHLQTQPSGFLIAALAFEKISNCVHTPAIIKGSSATATLTVTFSSNAAGVPNNQNSTVVTLIQESNGAWKIDALQGQ